MKSVDKRALTMNRNRFASAVALVARHVRRDGTSDRLTKPSSPSRLLYHKDKAEHRCSKFSVGGLFKTGDMVLSIVYALPALLRSLHLPSPKRISSVEFYAYAGIEKHVGVFQDRRMPSASKTRIFRRCKTVFLLLGVLMLPSQAFALTEQVHGMCVQAEQLINSGKTLQAVKLLEEAGRMDPTAGEVHGYLGMAYQNSGNPQRAIPEYRKALELNPQMTFINVNLGTCLMNMNQLDQAVPYFQYYLQTNPNAPDAAQVKSYIQQAGSRKGQQNLRAVVEQGQTLVSQKRFNDACSVFHQAIEIDPNFAPAHFYLGYSLAECGHNMNAITEFKNALQIDPSLKEALLNIGSNYQTLGDSKNAISWYDRYLRETPGSPKTSDIKQRIVGLKQQLGSQQGGQAGGSSPSDPDYFMSAASGGKFFRWPIMPVRVFIANGAHAPGYRDTYRKVLMDAFSAWAVASGNRIAFSLSSDPSQTNIMCDWTGDPNKVVERGRPVEGGLTKLSGQPQGGSDVAIVSARITILTNRGGMPLTDDDMKIVCLHEVGHALGINGHSNSNADVMFFSEAPTIWPALTKRDRATISRLYANYPPQAR